MQLQCTKREERISYQYKRNSNMTEIHERLQPVAEVGENGEEDSISGEQALIPLGI